MVGIVLLLLLALRNSIGVVACLTAQSGPLVDLNDACTVFKLFVVGGDLHEALMLFQIRCFVARRAFTVPVPMFVLFTHRTKPLSAVCTFVPQVAYRRLIGTACFSTEGLGLVELKARISIKLATAMTTGNVGRTFAQVHLDVIVTLILLATGTVNAFPFRTTLTNLLIIRSEAPSSKVTGTEKSRQRGQYVVVFVLVENG